MGSLILWKLSKSSPAGTRAREIITGRHEKTAQVPTTLGYSGFVRTMGGCLSGAGSTAEFAAASSTQVGPATRQQQGYGTVENANALPPLTTGQKFRIATASVFDWGAYPFNGALSAIAQARNDPKEWGQGWDAYGKRFGASFADNSIGTYMTVAVFPTLFREDPRYYQLGRGGFRRRAYHAVNRLFVTRTDSGHERFNYSESIGNAVAAAISNIYHVPSDRTASRNATTFAFLIIYDGLSNGLKEFWPDIRRKVFHKNTP